MTSLTLENAFFHLDLLPEIGGKISSLRSKKSGREWLWLNPHLPITPPVYGASYTAHMDSGGWDEIFPSVSPDEIDHFSIPDHGDLVGLPWHVIDQQPHRIHTRVNTRFAATTFDRTLELVGDTLEIRYALTSEDPRSIPYLWCAHPLIALEPGMRIHIPKGTPMLARGGVNVSNEPHFHWPHFPGIPNIDIIPDPNQPHFEPFALKMFTAANEIQQISISAPDEQEQLSFSWSGPQIAHLGLWLNVNGWSGCNSAPYFNLGLEPASAPFDAISHAIADGCGHSLSPGQCLEWAVSVTLITQQRS